MAMPSFAEFIRANKAEIVDEWKRRSREAGQAQKLEDVQLVDHIPFLLDRLAELSDSFVEAEAKGVVVPEHANEPRMPEPREHARQRVVEGFDLSDVVGEYALLRECILDLWEKAHGEASARTSTRPLNRALDHAVAESVDHYVTLRNRALRAMDDVAAAAFACASPDELFKRLLQVFTETMPAVQTCAILIRDGDFVRVRAAVGLEEELTRNFAMRVGEGFAGTIAATGQPMLLREASTDPLVKSPVIRTRKIKALYGVPMRHELKGVIGVAHMGSLTADDFSHEDKDLFQSMVSRAALAIEYLLARHAAERAVASRDDILAVVSHDLRNPLSNVRVSIGLLRSILAPAARTEGVEKALGSIDRAATRMTRLVTDLLDIGAIEARTLRVEIRPEVAAEIVKDAIDAHVEIALERGVKLSAEVASGIPPLRVDRERISQALTNLLSNAIKFSHPGGEVVVGCSVEGAYARFFVRDAGTGIGESERRHVFDRYFQGQQSDKRGRGLGLAIVKGIVEAHGGSVGVASELGKGSTFWFRVPLASPDG